MKPTPVSYKSVSGMKFTPEAPGNYPGILWLHGLNGSWGKEGIGLQMKQGLQVDAAVYCLDNPNQGDWARLELLDAIALMKQGNHPWLEVYGYSQGGMGVLRCLNLFPEEFKLYGIIAGKDAPKPPYDRFKDLHIRAWHGTQDKLMGFSVYPFIEGVTSIGGDATLIKYEAAHGIVAQACHPTHPDSLWMWRESRISAQAPAPEPVVETATLEVVNGELYAVTASKRYRVNVPLTEA